MKQRLKLRKIDPIIQKYLETRMIGRPRSKHHRKHLHNLQKYKKFAPMLVNQLKPSMTLIQSASNSSEYPLSRLPEIAFIGRSNSGKSSLLNFLVGRQNRALVKKTPGSTKTINFYEIGRPQQISFVDIPGYGFAVEKEERIKQWTENFLTYLGERKSLKLVLMVIDSRVGVKNVDREMMAYLSRCGVSWGVVLSKCDLTGSKRINKRMQMVREEMGGYKGSVGRIFPVSSVGEMGLNDLRGYLDGYRMGEEGRGEERERRWSDLLERRRERLRRRREKRREKREGREGKEAEGAGEERRDVVNGEKVVLSALRRWGLMGEVEGTDYHVGKLSGEMVRREEEREGRERREERGKVRVSVMPVLGLSNDDRDSVRAQRLFLEFMKETVVEVEEELNVERRGGESREEERRGEERGEVEEGELSMTKEEWDKMGQGGVEEMIRKIMEKEERRGEKRRGEERKEERRKEEREDIAERGGRRSRRVTREVNSLQQNLESFSAENWRSDPFLTETAVELPTEKETTNGRRSRKSAVSRRPDSRPEDVAREVEIDEEAEIPRFSEMLLSGVKKRSNAPHLSFSYEGNHFSGERAHFAPPREERAYARSDTFLSADDLATAEEKADKKRGVKNLSAKTHQELSKELLNQKKLKTLESLFDEKNYALRTAFANRLHLDAVSDQVVNKYGLPITSKTPIEKLHMDSSSPSSSNGRITLRTTRTLPKGIKKWKVLGKPRLKTPANKPRKDVAEFFHLKNKNRIKRTNELTFTKAAGIVKKSNQKLDSAGASLVRSDAYDKKSIIERYVAKQRRMANITLAKRKKQLDFEPFGTDLMAGGKGDKGEMGGDRKGGERGAIKRFFTRKGHLSLLKENVERRAVDYQAIAKYQRYEMKREAEQKRRPAEEKAAHLKQKGLRFRVDNSTDNMKRPK